MERGDRAVIHYEVADLKHLGERVIERYSLIIELEKTSRFDLFTEVGRNYFGIALDLRGCALCDLLTIIQYGNPFANSHHYLHIVLHEQNSEAELFLSKADEFHQLHL